VACARRVGFGAVSSSSPTSTRRSYGAEADRLAADGFEVTAHAVDVSDRASVGRRSRPRAPLARNATSARAHPPGSRPHRPAPNACSKVDMLGMDYVLEAFLELVTDGTVAVCIASMAGYVAGLTRLAGGRPRHRGRPTTCSPRWARSTHRQLRHDLRGGEAESTSCASNRRRLPWGKARWARREHQPRHHPPPPWAARSSKRARANRCRACSTCHRSRGSAPRRTSRRRWSGWPARAASFVTGCDLRVDGRRHGRHPRPHGLKRVTPTRWWRAACSRCRARPG